MMKKILVALDGSASSAEVFDQALTLARANGAQLMLLHVLAVDEIGQPLMAVLKRATAVSSKTRSQGALQQSWKAHQTEWESRLGAYVQQAVEAGIQAEFSQSYGNPGHVICDWAWTWDADLILLGRQGQQQAPAWRLGSVSAYVSQNTRCSVMMVSPKVKLNAVPAQVPAALSTPDLVNT